MPFCRRTRQNTEGFREWICATHWRLVDPIRRKAYQRRKRRARHFGSALDFTIAWVLWASVRRQAIERALGAA